MHTKAFLKNEETKIQGFFCTEKIIKKFGKQLTLESICFWKKINWVLGYFNGCSYWKMKCIHPCQGLFQSPEQACKMPDCVFVPLMFLPPERPRMHVGETEPGLHTCMHCRTPLKRTATGQQCCWNSWDEPASGVRARYGHTILPQYFQLKYLFESIIESCAAVRKRALPCAVCPRFPSDDVTRTFG